jgi:hypothetical protein
LASDTALHIGSLAGNLARQDGSLAGNLSNNASGSMTFHTIFTFPLSQLPERFPAQRKRKLF